MQYLPLVSSWVDHTRFKTHKATPPYTSTLAFGNAWWGRTYGSFTLPPSSSLRLLLVAVHINQWNLVKPKAASDFLKKAAPIGARDTRTLSKLKDMGVSTYFSGCLTLTWNPNIRNQSPTPRTQVVVVDTSSGKQGVSTLVPEAYLNNSLEYSNHLGSVTRPSFHWPFQFAYGSLLTIAQARVVVTSRIHVALPAVGLGTPVIFAEEEGNSESGLPGGSGRGYHKQCIKVKHVRWHSMLRLYETN